MTDIYFYLYALFYICFTRKIDSLDPDFDKSIGNLNDLFDQNQDQATPIPKKTWGNPYVEKALPYVENDGLNLVL